MLEQTIVSTETPLYIAMLPTDSVWVWITDNYKYTCTLKENIFDDNNLSSILKKNQIISAVAYLILLQIIDNKQIVHNYFLWCIYMELTLYTKY